MSDLTDLLKLVNRKKPTSGTVVEVSDGLVAVATREGVLHLSGSYNAGDVVVIQDGVILGRTTALDSLKTYYV